MIDRERIGQLLASGVERTKEFNRKPPKWFYWVLGIGIVLLFQFVRVIFTYPY